jgi:hypothetical protein
MELERGEDLCGLEIGASPWLRNTFGDSAVDGWSRHAESFEATRSLDLSRIRSWKDRNELTLVQRYLRASSCGLPLCVCTPEFFTFPCGGKTYQPTE